LFDEERNKYSSVQNEIKRDKIKYYKLCKY